MIKTPSKQLSLSSSKRNFSKTSISSKSSLIKQSIKKQRKETDDNIECKFCKQSFSLREYFHHLELNCDMFIKQPLTKKVYSLKDKEIISRLNINAIQTPTTEQPDGIYIAMEMKDHKDLVLSCASKEYKPSNKPTLVKEIEVLDLSISQVPLKSNLFCAFSLVIKGKASKNYIAYRIQDKNIEILDLADDSIAAILQGHKDNIVEIRYHRNQDNNVLLTSSYDEFVIAWDIETFNIIKQFNFKSWVLSSVIVSIDDKEVIVLAGGYSKNYPIKVYDYETQEVLYDIPICENATPSILSSYKTEIHNFLFMSTDNENPLLYIIDLNNRKNKVIKIFHVKSAITSIIPYSVRSQHISLYTSDYSGTITEFNVLKQTKVVDYSPLTTCIDLLLWDDYFLVTCGEKNGSLMFLIRHKNRKYKSYSNIHQKVILNIQKLYINGIGNCLISLSADKKIKIHRI